MDQNTFDKKFRSYKRIAASFSAKDYAEDAASEAILIELEHPQWRQTYAQRVICALRKLKVHRNNYNVKIMDIPHDGKHNDLDVDKILSKLDPFDRAIVSLYFLWGLSIIEISKVFGIKTHHISNRLRAALGSEPR